MSSTASNLDQDLPNAILQHVEHGAYPESDEVASAEIPSESLPGILEAVDKARETVKDELRNLSRQSASDLDGWIAQAKQLQKDIEHSKATAREIVQEAEAAQSLHAHVEDASSKVELLKRELDYNVTLAGIAEQLQVVTGLLDNAQDLTSQNALLEALKRLTEANGVINQLDTFENSRFAGLVQRRASQIRELLGAKIIECWNALITPSPLEGQIIINAELIEGDLSMTLEDVTEAMSELGMLDTYLSRFHRDLDTVIISPVFSTTDKGMTRKAVYGTGSVHVSQKLENSSPSGLIHGARDLLDFLTKELPAKIHRPLLERLLPSLMVQLITNTLDPSIPVELDQMGDFQNSLSQIEDLANHIDTLQIPIPSDGDLSSWIERLPQTWLSRRREAALTQMRLACREGVKTKKTAERVETQMVSSDDVMVSNGQEDDEWNADWAEDEEGDEQAPPADTHKPAEDDEDASAWGLEDEPEVSQDKGKSSTTVADGEDEEEAWGWGDGDAGGDDDESSQQPEQTKPTSTVPTTKSKPKVNGSSAKRQPPTEREITLRETFAITAIPDSILKLIDQVLADAEVLSQPSFPVPSISAAGPALSSLPTLLLALYRATASKYYESDPTANILIYNDSQHLAGSLETLLSQLSEDHPLYKRLTRSLEADIKLLNTYSRLAYGREMDSQRTILADLLSATSGFANCTKPQNSGEYNSAVDDVVHRVREVNKMWTDVLSDSARLQSLGAILSHVIHRIVTEILELADEPSGISEEESKALKGYMDQVSKLSDLFEQDTQDENGEKRTSVHVYTPSWLRFVYLGEILEASLADIKFLWNEGELSLEFEAAEVVELIEALFAESQFRRDAIREIRGR